MKLLAMRFATAAAVLLAHAVATLRPAGTIPLLGLC
jgi:hypothetical protein